MSYIIKGPDRRLSNKASIYEVVRAISVRTEHLEKGAPSYVDSTDMDDEDIAIKELIEKKCPFKVLRKLTSQDGVAIFEEWSINELIIDYTKLVV